MTAEDTAVALRVYIGAFVDELARAGVRDVCICPGSRSTPLAMLIREHSSLKVWTHLDERSASFFALGMAKASGRATAVLCTSGTAAANFMPAVAEAHNGGVPLILLTADRPQELRDVGALQTIDQVRMYGSHAKWATEMLLPEATDAAARHARYAADRAVATALSSPRGPVHLNFPFREPLVPAPADARIETVMDRPGAISLPERRTSTPVPEILGLANSINGLAKGLVVCGALDEDPEIADFASVVAAGMKLPLLADVLSQNRTGTANESDEMPLNLIDRYDAFLRHGPTAAALGPDYILRMGATPVSKPLQQYLEHYNDRPQVLFAAPGTLPDQGLSATNVLWCHEVWADATVFSAIGSHEAMPADEGESLAWNQAWRSLNNAAHHAIESALAPSDSMTEPLVFRRLADLVPEDAIVFAGNSMPVRDLDSFWPASTKRVRFMANRGASGIDGVVSTALGAAAVSEAPLVLVIGDISLYHDMNGLLAANRHRLNATIIVLNNDGGGIFSFLPQAEQGEHFEELFGTPHGLDFRHTAALYGLDYRLTPTRDEFDEAVTRSLKSDGVSLIEVRTDRAENLALHRKIWAAVAEALVKVKL
jgi:2-succinyl-5-enolpyruvyl-6-hydroxy-3-cyclohexene-1-carboxylate synthase